MKRVFKQRAFLCQRLGLPQRGRPHPSGAHIPVQGRAIQRGLSDREDARDGRRRAISAGAHSHVRHSEGITAVRDQEGSQNAVIRADLPVVRFARPVGVLSWRHLRSPAIKLRNAGRSSSSLVPLQQRRNPFDPHARVE